MCSWFLVFGDEQNATGGGQGTGDIAGRQASGIGVYFIEFNDIRTFTGDEQVPAGGIDVEITGPSGNPLVHFNKGE
jgi:hypothetical protein